MRKGSFTIKNGMDIVGFALLILGGIMLRYGKDEFTAISGGFVIAGGMTIISLSRYTS